MGARLSLMPPYVTGTAQFPFSKKKKKARESEEKMLLAAQSLEEVLIPQRTAKCRRKLAGSKITLRSRKFQSQLRERKERMTPNAAGCDSDVATVKDREGAPI